MRLNLLLGIKEISIREGHRDYKPGPGVICDPTDSFVVGVTFTNIVHKTLGEVTEEEWLADGFTGQEDLLSGMREYYPNIELNSPVTILFWKNVSGCLTDSEMINAFKEAFDL